jgi:hypothetical protein
MNDTILVRGFDLFFTNLSNQSLENIAKQLGGRYSFNFSEGRATYMFESIQMFEHIKIKELHSAVNAFGELFALTYDCTYLHNELYLTVPKSTLPKIKRFIL